MMLAVVKANADTTAVLLTETDVQMVLLGRTFLKVTPPIVMADIILLMRLGIREYCWSSHRERDATRWEGEVERVAVSLSEL